METTHQCTVVSAVYGCPQTAVLSQILAPGSQQRASGPRDEHSKEAGRFLRTGWPFGWPLLWFLSSALKAGRRDWDPARALPNCGSRLNFSFTTSEPWENSVSKVVSKWDLIKGGRNDNRVHLLKCDEGNLLCSLFLFLFFGFFFF